MTDGESTRELTPLDAPASVEEELRARNPSFLDAVARLANALTALATYAAPSEIDGPRSLHRIINQAINDMLDLLYDVSRGRGRPAARTARSLFELVIAMLDVLDDEEMDQRYHNHWMIAGTLVSPIREIALLDGTDRSELAARSQILREESEPMRVDLVERYGQRYQREWAGQNLFTRAQAHGLEEDYKTFYRWSSSISHGSAAGMFGQFRVIAEEPVYRFGPAIEAAPTALAYGLAYFTMILDRYEPLYDPDNGIPELREALSNVADGFTGFRDALSEIDEELWPAAPASNHVPLLGLGLMGSRRWFILDQQQERFIHARPVTDFPAGFDESIRRIHARLAELRVWSPDRHVLPLPPTRWITVGVIGADLRPVPGAAWQPAQLVMPPSGSPFAEYTPGLIAAGIATEALNEELKRKHWHD